MVARRTTADKRREMTRGGGVGATTNQRTRDEGSKEEGEDSKGDGDATVTAAMDGATVMTIDGNGGDGRRDGTIAAQTTINMWQGYEVWASALMPLGVVVVEEERRRIAQGVGGGG